MGGGLYFVFVVFVNNDVMCVLILGIYGLIFGGNFLVIVILMVVFDVFKDE